MLHIVKQPVEELQATAAQYISKLLRTFSGTSILFLSSAGSNFPLLEKVETEYLSPKITIGVLDERYDKDPKVNNFAQLTQLEFYTKAKEKGCEFIDTQVKEGESQKELAKRFNEALHTWRAANPKGMMIATQGIGPDGHTSGMMPFSEDPDKFMELFAAPEEWVVSYDAKSKNEFPLRVTTTISFLKEIDYSVLYVVGEKKYEVLQEIIDYQQPIPCLPGCIIHEMKDVRLFTDTNVVFEPQTSLMQKLKYKQLT